MLTAIPAGSSTEPSLATLAPYTSVRVAGLRQSSHVTRYGSEPFDTDGVHWMLEAVEIGMAPTSISLPLAVRRAPRTSEDA